MEFQNAGHEKVLKDERKFPNLMKNFLKNYREEVLENFQ